MQKREPKSYIKKIVISFFVAVLISIISIFSTRIKIQVDYPAMSTGIKLVQNDNSKELDTKRFYGDQVFANAKIADCLEWGQVCIYFICDSGTQISVENVRVSVGSLVARTYVELDDGYYIGTNELEVLAEENGEKLLETTGNNPYIMLSHFKRTMVPYILIHTMIVFAISFVVAFAAVLFWSKKKDVIKANVRTLGRSLKIKFPKSIICILSLFVIMYGCYLILLRYEIVAFSFINSWEIWFLICGFVLLFFQLKRRTNNWWALIGCLIVAGLFLFFSIYDLTTYMTIDEPRAIEEQVNFQGSDFRHWYLDCAHMNFSIMGTVWNFVPKSIVENEMIMAEQLAKLLHWICGIILLYIIVGRIEVYLADKDKKYDRCIVYTVILTALLMIPVVNEALKNYNYDLFSMLLGLWGVVEVCICIVTQKKRYGFLGVGILALGMIEKRLVLPIWLAGMVLVIWTCFREKKNEVKNAFWSIFSLTCVMLGETVLVIYANQVYVFDVLREVSPIYLGVSEAIDMLLSLPQIGIVAIGKLVNINISSETMKVMAIIGYLLGIIACIKLIDFIYDSLIKSEGKIKVNKMLVVIQLIFLLIGIGYSIYKPLGNADGYIELWANYGGIFVQALPTVLLGMAIISAIKIWNSERIEYYGVIQLLASVGISIIYVITEEVSARYSNLYIVLYVLCSVIILSECYIEKKKILYVTMSICSIVTCVELLGSRPAYSCFIPAWDIIPSEMQERELAAYWGENWVLLAEVLEEYCEENDIDASMVNLHCSYAGHVLKNKTDVNIGQYWWRLDGYENPTENDYFVFETRSINQGYFEHGLPEAEPVITVKYHGAITARIYKGTDLISYFEQYKVAAK